VNVDEEHEDRSLSVASHGRTDADQRRGDDPETGHHACAKQPGAYALEMKPRDGREDTDQETERSSLVAAARCVDRACFAVEMARVAQLDEVFAKGSGSPMPEE